MTNYGKMAVNSMTVSGGLGNYGVMNIGSLGGVYGGFFGLYNAAGATLTTGGVGVDEANNDGLWNAGGIGLRKYGVLVNSGVLNIRSGGGFSIYYGNDFRNSGTVNSYGKIYLDSIRGGGGFGNSGVFNNYGDIVDNNGIGNSGTFVNYGSIELNNYGLGGGGSYTQNGSQSSTLVDAMLASDTAIQINGGLVSGSGVIAADLNMRGTLHPGDANCMYAPCILTIQGNYQQFGIGTLHSELGGTKAGQNYDQLVITGNATLDGVLDVDLVNGFVPKPGDTFFLLTYAGETGKFATLDLPSLPLVGETWEYAYEPTDFKLWIASGNSSFEMDPVPEPSSLVLLGGGLLSMPGVLRRKRL